MKSTRSNMPSKKRILSRWLESGLIANEECDETDICFACGDISQVERAHIVPIHAGGDNSEGNLHLLCKRCHADSEFCENYEQYMRWFLHMRSPNMQLIHMMRIRSITSYKLGDVTYLESLIPYAPNDIAEHIKQRIIQLMP